MLLLDTSALLWLVIDSPQLGSQARRRIARTPTVHYSAVSAAEIVIKSMLGRIDVPGDLTAALRDQSLTELPLTTGHAQAVRRFPLLTHHDPFDRLLLAQAASSGLDFVTADRVLLALDLDFVVDAGA